MYEENEINIRDLIIVCLKKFKFILLSGLIVALLALGYTVITRNNNNILLENQENQATYIELESYELELTTYNFMIKSQNQLIEDTVNKINYYNDLLNNISYDSLDEYNIYHSHYNIISSGIDLNEIYNILSDDDFLEGISENYSLNDLEVLIQSDININEDESFLSIDVYTGSKTNSDNLVNSINSELELRNYEFEFGQISSNNGYSEYIDNEKSELNDILSGYQEILDKARSELKNIEKQDIPVDPSTQVNDALIKNSIIGLVLGLFISVGYVLIRFFFNDKFLRASDINVYSNLPIFGVFRNKKSKNKLLNYLEADINEFDDDKIYEVISANMNVIDCLEFSLISSSIETVELEKLKKELLKINKDLKIIVLNGDIDDPKNINSLKFTKSVVMVEHRGIAKNKDINKLYDFLKAINRDVLGYIIY